MTNSIVKAYEWLDRDVLLRQYSKVAKRWEDSGRNIYHLSSAFGLSGLVGLLFGTHIPNITIPQIVLTIPTSLNVGEDLTVTPN